MPGISLLRGNGRDVETVADEAFESVKFFDDYEATTEFHQSGTVVGHTGYPSYPVRRVETEDAVVLLEGHIYDVDDVDDHLERLGRAVARDRTGEVADWLHGRDGDFLLLTYRKAEGDVYVFNDPFSRLPTYVTTRGDDIVLSRELKYVREVARRRGHPVQLDQVAAGQLLLFGYTLGERTLFDDVQLVPPGSMVHIDDEVRITQYFQHRFEETTHGDRSVDENASALASRFATACENRDLAGRQNLVSLSGGLDSRTVAGAYDALDIPVTAASFDFESGTTADDVRVAREIAETLDVDWSCFEVSDTPALRSRLLEFKQGMNFLGMGFILDFFRQVQSEYGRPTHVTGDGGDKILVDMRPPREFDTMDSLVEFIVQSNSRMSLSKAAAVANISPETLRESVRDRVRSYPERDLSQRYVHFLFRERGVNFLNQGEDRNRYYFWTVTPFYSLPVFEYAMNCPDDQKRHRELYAAFLEEFEPALLDIEYPNFSSSITSLEYKAKRITYDFLGRYPALQDAVVNLVASSSTPDDSVARAIQQDVSNADVTPLSRTHTVDVASRFESFGSKELDLLHTLTSVVTGMAEQEEAEAIEADPVPN